MFDFVYESDYKRTMMNTVIPCLESRRTSGSFMGVKNHIVGYRKYSHDNPICGVIIVHGLRESGRHYDEIVYYLLRKGCTVYTIDLRGHGESGRLGKDDFQIDVDDFDDYSEDLAILINTVIGKECIGKKYLLGHSLGAAVIVDLIEKNPSIIDAAVLFSPMFRLINEMPITKLLSFLCAAGFGGSYLPGKGKFSRTGRPDGKIVKHGARSDYVNANEKASSVLQHGGPSIQWLGKAILKTHSIMDKESLSRITIPILLFSAECEIFIDRAAHDLFARTTNNSMLINVKKAKHGILWDNDHVHTSVLNELYIFLGL